MGIHKRLWLAFAAMVAIYAITRADEKVLYDKESRYNTIVVTEDAAGLRTLWFRRGGARQSAVKLGDPDHLEFAYSRVMPVGLAFVETPRRVLMVGLGGGTIPMFLHKHYPKTVIDAVDIDPDVIDVAKRFFGFREDATLRAYAEDGRRFIEARPNHYDIIFLDAFGPDSIPYHLATREFLQAVRRALAPGGIAVGNIWDRDSNDLYDSMLRTYRDVFEELYVFDVRHSGNKILVALPRKERIEMDDLARRARQIARQKGFRFDLGKAVVYGYRRVTDEPLAGRVLRDDGPEDHDGATR